MSRFFKLTVAYEGTDFSGWQIQPGRTTIQGELEKALAIITKTRVAVVGSGRTDSGVHAIAQVASCEIPDWRAPASNLASAMNTKLPDAIVVTDAQDAMDGFHAIRDAQGKRYRYRIRVGGTRDVFEHRYHWHLPGPLNFDAMARGAAKIVGLQDFACFQAVGAKRKSTVRHVTHCELSQRILRENSSNSGPVFDVDLEIEANGFLYNMVRNIVGSLVEVGRGKRDSDWIDELIAAKNRDLAGPTAPPQGLFLQQVHYDPNTLRSSNTNS